MELVKHVAALPGFIGSVNHMLRPGGHTSLATTNRNPVLFAGAIDGTEYLFRILLRGHPSQQTRFIKPTPGKRGSGWPETVWNP
ncbi:hypothetical protein [Thioalkalivibrio sp. ALJ24]|uniref:hypothetical protein n=1 Tax=Thioalkalivibrio sp. ALJ24 TaxID=545276 RepID=UPI00036125EE